MTTAYQTARSNGWLPPLAAAVAAYRSLPGAARSIRTIDPQGAALIFALAWLAGYAGSLAALLIVAALLAGLYAARISAVQVSPNLLVPISPAPVSLTSPGVCIAPDTRAEQFAGLVVREVKLGQPATNGKAPKVTTTK